MLASSGVGLKLWNLETLQLVKEYPIIGSRSGQLALITNFSVKSDNSQIASVVDTDSINLLSLETQVQFDLKDAIDTKCCCFDSAGRYLATGNSNGFIEIYDVKSQSLKKKTWKVQNSKSVNCICYSKNDRFIAIGNSNGSISLFNTLTNTMGKPWLYNSKSSMSPPMVTAIQYSAVNSSLAAAYDDGSVILWDGSKEQPICAFQSHNAPCTSISLSPLNFILMVSGGLDNVYTMYDTSAKKVIRQVNCPGGITSLDMLKNGYSLAVGTANGQLHMYDLRQNDGPYQSAQAHDTSVYSVKFIPNLVLPTGGGGNNANANKENKYLTSTINGSSSSGDMSMKRSNSYNNSEQLSNIANSPMYNIYSPEKNYNSQSTATLNQQSANQFSGGGESFILHKKQSTSNLSLNTQPVQTPSNDLDSTVKLDQRRQIVKPKTRPNELFSPILSQPQQKPKASNLEVFSSTTIQKSNLNGDHDQSAKKLSPNIKKQSPFLKNSKNSMDLGTPTINEPVSRIGQRNMDFEMDTQDLHNPNKSPSVAQQQLSKSLPVDQFREIIKDEIDEFKDELMSENFRFKAEMLKEFMQLRSDMKKYFELYSPNEALMNELAKLREENKRLKKLF